MRSASLHASTNLFENVVLDLAKKLAWIAGIACFGAVLRHLRG